MIGKYFGLIEALGSGAIVLGFCGYQLWATNRSIRRDRELESFPLRLKHIRCF